MRVVVTSPRAIKAFEAALGRLGAEVLGVPLVSTRPVPMDVAGFLDAARKSDVAVFVSGMAAYRLAEEARAAGLAVEVGEALRGLKIYTVEGDKGAVMVRNALGVEAAHVDSSRELPRLVDGPCRGAVVVHHGERAVEVVETLVDRCGHVYEFSAYIAERAPDHVARLLVDPGGDIYVFFSALAVRYAFEGPIGEALRERMRSAVAVAAGPAVAEALREWGVEPIVARDGRIGPVIELVRGLLEGRNSL